MTLREIFAERTEATSDQNWSCVNSIDPHHPSNSSPKGEAAQPGGVEEISRTEPLTNSERKLRSLGCDLSPLRNRVADKLPEDTCRLSVVPNGKFFSILPTGMKKPVIPDGAVRKWLERFANHAKSDGE